VTARAVWVLVPDGIDDPMRPSGGNRYDRRVCDGLRTLGWRVRERAIPGAWPHPDGAARRRLADALNDAGDGDLVRVDGLIASPAGDLVAAAAERLRLAVLLHMPFGPVEPELRDRERLMLSRVPAVLATSRWTREFLLREYRLSERRVHVASPGADRAGLVRPDRIGTTAGTAVPDGGRLLCVAAVTRAKGYDVLLAALSGLGAREWQCRLVGSPDVDPTFSSRMRRSGQDPRLAGRVRFTGALPAAELDAAWAQTDLLVLPSRSETWGMVITEALARGIPVLASDVGGIPEALGTAPDGTVPGLLVPPGDASALAGALARWLDDAALRGRLRSAALARRATLPGWRHTAARIAAVLTGLAREPWGEGASGPVAATAVRSARGWTPSTSR
jgi:glycosyltransferase involved in cell wall biosynthesis